MAGLSDKELYVRWSSAKGLGRITNRLRKSYAAQLVSFLCDRISSVALLACDHYALQGGCLALAELARRGLLLPERLDAVMPIVHKSLNYDEKLGHQTYGHIVRDAACYVSIVSNRITKILLLYSLLGVLVVCSCIRSCGFSFLYS